MKKALIIILAALFSATPLLAFPGIITLAPSLTETVAFVGGTKSLVAVSAHCVSPPAVAFLPKAGGYQGIDYEKIMRLSPDLVLCIPAQREVPEKLSRMGISCEVIRQDTLDDIYRSVMRIGRLLGLEEQAKEKLLSLRRKVLALRAASSQAKRVLLVIGNVSGELKDIYVVGRKCFLGQLLNKLGFDNACEAELEYPRVTVEQIVRMQPDSIILFSDRTDLDSKDVTAIKKPWYSLPLERDYSIQLIAGDHVFIPGPRFIQTMQDIAGALQSTL